VTSSEVGVTAARVVAAEWTKLASLSSTTWLTAGTVCAAAVQAFVLGLFAGPGDAVSASSLASSGYLLAQLGPLVLGVLVGSTDFTVGTSLTTYAAVPRRIPVLLAQVVLTTALTLVTGVAAISVSLAATAGARRTAGLSWTLSSPSDLRTAVGYVLFLAGAGVCGVLLGSLLRRPLAALATAVALFVLLDQVLATHPGHVVDTVRALLPSSGTRMFADEARLSALGAGHGPHLGVGGGGLVLAAWCVALTALAGFRLVRRDVS
jgi:ABC-2 type transport system permease protein